MENIQSVHFTVTVVTDQRTITKTGTTYRELADSLDDLYDESLCPFPADMDDDDPEWWEWNDECEEITDDDHQDHALGDARDSSDEN